MTILTRNSSVNEEAVSKSNAALVGSQSGFNASSAVMLELQKENDKMRKELSEMKEILSTLAKTIGELKFSIEELNSQNVDPPKESKENKSNYNFDAFEKELKEMLRDNESTFRSLAEKLKKELDDFKAYFTKLIKHSQEEMVHAIISKKLPETEQKNFQAPKPGPKPGSNAAASLPSVPKTVLKSAPVPISVPVPEKVVVKEIKDSKIRNNDLYYQVLTDKNIIDWFRHSDINGSQSKKEAFHASNPGAPSLKDLEVDRWQTLDQERKRISQKLALNKTITHQDLDFIIMDNVELERKPTAFTRCAFKPSSLRQFRQITYRQRNKLLHLCLKREGLAGYVCRSSWVGSSVIEFYISVEHVERFKLGMTRMEYVHIEDYNPEVLPSFEGVTPLTEFEKSIRKEKLVQRLGFLHASSRLIKLKECIIENLSEGTIQEVLERSYKIHRNQLTQE